MQRMIAVDYLRVVLAGFVVVAHSGLARQSIRDAGEAGLVWLALGNSVLRVAVPVFTLIAGWFLAGVMRRGGLSGWAGHLLVLYAVWSAIYLVFLGPYYANRPLALTGSELVLGFMHLWFLQGLAVAGVLLAGFAALGRGAVAASAVVLGGAGLALQYARMAGLSEVPMEHYRNGPLYLYPYLAMGWLMAQGLPRIGAGWLWAAAVLGLAACVAENLFWLHRIGEDPLLEMPPGHLLACPAILLLVMRWRLPRTDLPLGRAAAAIYVAHVLVLQGLPMLGIDHPPTGAVLGFLLPLAVVLALDQRRAGQATGYSSRNPRGISRF